MDVKNRSLIDLSIAVRIRKNRKYRWCYQIYQALAAAVELKLFDFLENEGACDRKFIAEGIGINGCFPGVFWT
jgi:N-acetyl-gamma-glutamylphosphate reductase